jgi:hypothetical protein
VRRDLLLLVRDNERLFYRNLLRQCREAGRTTTSINVSGLEALLKEGEARAEAERQRMFDGLVQAVYGSSLRRPAAYSEVLWGDLLASVRRLASHPSLEGSGQDRGGDLQRRPLLRGWVSRGKMRGGRGD